MSTFYKVQTGFQIVDSNGVPGTPIDGISSELTESVSKLPTDKAVHDAIEVAKQECKSVLASSEEVEVTGVGTEESPYTLDLTGKVHSSTGVDLQSEEGSNITMFSSLDIGATASRSISVEAGNSINVTSTGQITETAVGPLSIVSTGATADFKGAGPTTLESTGGAPVTVKSNGNSSNYSSLVFTPNAGTLSVNASSANHTLSMYSKSVVEGTTKITELNLNDSTGVSLHSSYAPIRVTADDAPIYLSSPAGAPIQISSNVIGGQYGYALVQTQGTSVTLKSYWDSTNNGELAMSVNTMKLTQKGDANSYLELQSRNDSVSPTVYSDLKLTPSSATISIPTTTSPTSLAVSGDSSIYGQAKSITLVAGVVQGDTGTASVNIGAVQGNTVISGSSISLIGAPNGSFTIDSNGTSIIDPSNPVSISSDTFVVNVKYDNDERHYSSSLNMGTNATLSSYNSVLLTNSEYGSSIGVNSSGKIVGNGYSGVELVAEDDEHVILKANGEDNDGNIITSKLDLYANGDSYLTSPNGVIVETTEAPTHAIFRNVSDDGQGGTLTVGLDVFQGGATLSSQAGPITLLTDQAPINLTSTSAPINILSPAGAPIALRSALMSGSTYAANIQLTSSVSISSPGGTVGISSIGPTSLLSTQGNITLDTTVGEIKISSNGGAPITSKVTGDSTHYTTVTENVTGLSASVTGASSPLSFSMSGVSGQSSISMSAKSISLLAATIPTDTGTAAASIGGPMIGTLLFGTTGVSLLNPTLPTSITTTELILPAYNNTFDSTDTHKLMTYADSDGGVELATFADLTNEQFGLDENTEAGTMFWVNMTGASADTPEVETLAPGSVGQVLTIGSDGLPEWANGGGGGGGGADQSWQIAPYVKKSTLGRTKSTQRMLSFVPPFSTLTGFSVRFEVDVSTLSNFKCWVVLYETTENGGDLVTPFTGSLHTIPEGTKYVVSLDYDTPAIVDITKEYTVETGYYCDGGSKNVSCIWTSNSDVLNFREGVWMSPGYGDEYADPPSNLSAYTSNGTASYAFPWFALRGH